MYIAIKSEMDSRVVLYPLMRALRSYGSILVISNNKYVRRLIDDEEFATFRNISIIVDELGAADDVYEEFGIAPGDYDFIIIDNMGAVDYDTCFILRGSKCSEDFEEDIERIKASDDVNKVAIAKFGRQVKPKKEVKVKETVEVMDSSEYDPAEKFKKMSSSIDKKKIVILKEFQCRFPTFEQIEELESNHVFYNVDPGMINMFFTMLQSELHVNEVQFRKEVSKKDEGGGVIKPARSNR